MPQAVAHPRPRRRPKGILPPPLLLRAEVRQKKYRMRVLLAGATNSIIANYTSNSSKLTLRLMNDHCWVCVELTCLTHRMGGVWCFLLFFFFPLHSLLFFRHFFFVLFLLLSFPYTLLLLMNQGWGLCMTRETQDGRDECNTQNKQIKITCCLWGSGWVGGRGREYQRSKVLFFFYFHSYFSLSFSSHLHHYYHCRISR